MTAEELEVAERTTHEVVSASRALQAAIDKAFELGLRVEVDHRDLTYLGIPYPRPMIFVTCYLAVQP